MYNVLIADDEQLERQEMKAVLDKHFANMFEIKEAEDGKRAIELACEMVADIAILDINMPESNGIDTAKIIRNLFPNCKIIFLTAYSMFDYAQEAVKLKATDYILKPASDMAIINSINKAMQGIEQERTVQKMATKYSSIAKNLENQLIPTLLGGYVDDNYFLNYLSTIGLSFHQGFFGVLFPIFEDEMPESRKKYFLKCLEQRLRETMFFKQQIIFVYEFQNKIYWYAHGLEKEKTSQEAIKTLLLPKEQMWRIEQGFPVMVGIGEVFSDPEQAGYAFRRTKYILNECTTKKPIVCVGKNQKTIDHGKSHILFSKIFYNQIAQGEEEQAQGELEKLFVDIHIGYELTNLQKRIVYENITVVLNRLIGEYHLNQIGEIDIFDEIMSKNNEKELKTYLNELVTCTIDAIENKKNAKHTKVLYGIMENMKENCSQDISLETTAVAVGLTPVYLSKIFKKQFGENFIDVLTKLRIDKAKELLKNPKMSIKQISYLVGYYDPNYFAKVFKKITNLTPSEYRGKI